MVLVVALASCKKTPEVNLKYVDVERDLVTVGTTTANIQCDYDYIATLKKAYLYYGEGENEDAFTSAEMRVVQNTLYVELTGLRENTTYNYFYEFHNGFNFMRTALKSFKTETSPGGVTLPTVITAAVTEITTNSAKGGGEVTDDGGAEVTERGICWSTNANPTINNSHIAAGSGMGAFTAVMSDLEANTTYHVRAYAINEAGTAYGLDREFVTSGGGGGSGIPEGAIDGLFSVSPTQKVYISKGNLQYQASTNTWRFAEHQWDYVGGTIYSGEVQYGTVVENGVPCDNSLISADYNGWIDLFGWGTSGFDHGAVCYQPWSISTNYDDYDAYGQNTDFLYNLYDQTGQADWGYNVIDNGGGTNGIWRTLSHEELDYLFFSRNTLTNIRYVFAQVNENCGVIVLPDDWLTSYYPLNTANDNYSNNTITASQWSTLEQHGAVFLPSSGGRNGVLVGDVGSAGFYWSSSYTNSNDYFNTGHAASLAVGPKTGLSTGFQNFRHSGLSVRLVHDAGPQPSFHKPTVVTSDVSVVTSNSANCGGEVTNDGGAEVTERGICWSTNANPTISNSHTSAGSGMGAFSATMGGLSANTTYYVRAYATNEAGTAYGSDKEFTTLSGGGGSGNAPIGAIDGLFSVSPTKKVFFSQGNLQYQASTSTWRFAENQWNYVGGVDYNQNMLEYGNVYENGVKCDNAMISSTYSGWIDLFGYGTSGYNHGAICYQPWSISYQWEAYYAYGSVNSNLNDQNGQADWGYNRISNGGNVEGCWRTLSHEEWNYLINVRSTISGIRFVDARVNDVNGIIVLPDNWDASLYELHNINNANVYNNGAYDFNVVTLEEWELLENNGAVFIPSSGGRTGDQYMSNGYHGYYWSTTSYDDHSSYSVCFSNSGVILCDYWISRTYGWSVRLVQDAH